MQLEQLEGMRVVRQVIMDPHGIIWYSHTYLLPSKYKITSKKEEIGKENEGGIESSEELNRSSLDVRTY